MKGWDVMFRYIVAVLIGVLAALLTMLLVLWFRANGRVTYVDIQRWFKMKKSKNSRQEEEHLGGKHD
jgi:hypothetical protein